MQQGDVYERLDVASHRPFVAICSGQMFNAAGTGRLVVCPVQPISSDLRQDADFAAAITFEAGGLLHMLIPDLLHALPVAALGQEPIGALAPPDCQRLRQTMLAMFD